MKQKIETLIVVSFFLLTLTACEKIAVMATAKKQPIPSKSILAKTAENKFWQTLHSGNYQAISDTTTLLMAAYLENPHDPILAAHLGFLHIWKITERVREKKIPPTIVDHIILARKYFADAVELNPNDARFRGFLGDSLLVEGQIFQDKRQTIRGYFTLKKAIAKWPEFNYFTAGYPMSTLSPHSAQFKEGLAWQWKTLSLCAGTTVNQNNPDFSPYLNRETKVGQKRACWNSWIAPHNFEGFFLNMGDMLVKQGDPKTAIKIYQNAKLSKTYSAWPYRSMLEKRIRDAEKNVQQFQKYNTVLFNSGYGCVACHER